MQLASTVDQKVLRLFEHLERMDEYRLIRIVLMADINGRRVRNRPRLGSMNGAKGSLGCRGTTVEAAGQCLKDTNEWRTLVHL